MLSSMRTGGEGGTATGRQKRQRAYAATHTMASSTPVEKKRKGEAAQALLPAHIRSRAHGEWATLPAISRVTHPTTSLWHESELQQEFENADELE